MTVEEYWACVRELGLKNPQRASPDLDYIATTRDHQVAHVTDPERLTPEQRMAVCALLRQRHCGLNG